MRLSRRDALILLVGGTLGGAVATTTGLTYYYTKVKWYPGPPPPSEGWLLTQEDLDALAEADRVVESTKLDILDNTDIPGSGDYSSTRVRNLGECVAACEEDSNCKAFTYARSTHAQPAKRQMCWLKEDAPERIVVESPTYVSGRR